jgi:hypothetical protein
VHPHDRDSRKARTIGVDARSRDGDDATIEITPAGLAIMTAHGIAHDFD